MRKVWVVQFYESHEATYEFRCFRKEEHAKLFVAAKEDPRRPGDGWVGPFDCKVEGRYLPFGDALPFHTQRALCKAGISTWSQLASADLVALRQTRGFGPKSARYVELALKERGE